MCLFEKFQNKKEEGDDTYLERPLNEIYTPDIICALGPRDIFVFGSNLDGKHYGGAARTALTRFEAILGQGEGLQGRSYAIPTMQGGVETIKPYVDRFIEFAKREKALTFYVTKIGCGIAGFKISEIAPLFKDAIGVKNIRLPKEFVDIIEKEILIYKDELTHAHGVTRTFADVVIAINEENPLKSVDEVLTALKNYFHRFMENGDLVAFTALRIFWYVLREEDVFIDGRLNVESLRNKIFNFDEFSEGYDKAYLMYCKEKICNVVSFLNEFRRYNNPQQILNDISRSNLTGFSHCGPNERVYLMSPVNAGNGYPLYFFGRFLQDNWSKIAPSGMLDPDLLNEFMFDKHERGLKKYGLEAVIRHDYISDGPCHPEVYFPKRLGTGPVYVERKDRQFIRSCGEGKGPNAIPNYLENMIALELLKEDNKYQFINGYYIPVSDLSLPIYDDWRGKIKFKTIGEKRRFIEDLRRKDSGC